MSLIRRLASVPLAVLVGCGVLAPTVPAHADSRDTADVVAELPIGSFSQMAVDEANQHVFIAESWNSGTAARKLLVYDFHGELVTAWDDVQITALALSEDGRTLYAAGSALYEYDTATLTRKTRNYFQNMQVYCDRQFALSGDKVWYTHPVYGGKQGCADGQYELWNLTGPLNGETRTPDFRYAIPGPMRLAVSPKLPGKMVLGTDATPSNANPALYLLDISGEKIKLDQQRFFTNGADAAGFDLKDMAFSPDGKWLAVADGKGGHRLLSTRDLSDAATGYQPLTDGAQATAVAFSGDGEYIARGAEAPGGGADILVQNADPTTGTQQHAYVLDRPEQGDRVAQRGLAWGAKSRTLFAVTTNAEHSGYWLRVLRDPQPMYDTRFVGELAVDTREPVVGAALTVKGRLEFDGPAPEAPVKVTAVREDADGKHTVGEATVAGDGTFAVEDTPARVGRVVYTFSYAGDATHRPAGDATLTVDVTKAKSAIVLSAPERSRIGHALDFTGKLTSNGAAIPEGQTVTVFRKLPLGSEKPLGTATVASDGTFHVVDTPWLAGRTTYTVRWGGGDSHEGATGTATVKVGLLG